MHMLDASLRMVDGELPHVDFMTPIGILGFKPVAFWLGNGFMIGKATMLANVLVTALLMPFIWWVGATRLTALQAVYFGSIMVVLLTAVVFGGGSTAISLSMYYNRWAWGITFLILAVILFPARVQLAERWIGSLIIGGGMASLAMLKVTFFAPLAPAILLILVIRKQWRLAGVSILIGLLIGGILLAVLGMEYFLSYWNDLLAVAAPDSGRAKPGLELSTLLSSPERVLGSFVLLASLIVFRKSGLSEQGLVLLVLAPALTYITFQNWGNDPKWLFIVILYLWVNLPAHGLIGAFQLPARGSILVLIVMAITLAFPSAISLATSTFRPVFANRDEALLLEIDSAVADIWLDKGRILSAPARQVMHGMPPLVPDATATKINGYTFPECTSRETIVPMGVAMAREIEVLDVIRGKSVLTADILNLNWMLGDVGRVKGAAPWYYGDTSGLINADFLQVPLCPINLELRKAMVSHYQAANYDMEEVFRSDILVLYKLSKPEE